MKEYVKKYKGHDVPEGATHVSDFPTPQPIEFYRAIGGNHQYFNVGDNNPVWCKSIFNEPNKYAVPLPEQSMPSKAEWVPVGRCIHVYITSSINGVAKLREEEVNIIGLDKSGNYVFQNDKSTCYYSDPASEFRPLKTAEEKKREVFIEDLVKVLNSVPNGTSLSDLHAMAEKAYDAGYTAPEGEV